MASPDASQATKPESYGRFVHLHTHSHYSLLQALPKTKALVKATIERGMPALALTDAGNMYGTIEFYKECQKQGIKPIIGVDFYVAVRTRFDREPRIDNKRSRLVMLAKNSEGYRNLIKLVTASSIEGFYYKPRIDKELIEKHKEGLVVISPSFSGDIAYALKGNNIEHAKEIAAFYKTHFGDDFYLEVTHHPEVEDHQEAMIKVVEFAKNEGIKLVAAHDTYYIKPTDKKARETLVSVQDQFGAKSREDNADFSFITQEQAEEYFKNFPINSQKTNDGGLQGSGAEMNLEDDGFDDGEDDNFDPFTGEVINSEKEVGGAKKFKEDQKAADAQKIIDARGETINIEYALDSCKEIVDKCNLEIALGKWLFPEFTVESGRTADDELRVLTYAGLERRKVELTDEVKTRIDYELDVIKTKGYSPYFLVVADLLHYAHNNGILTNIRGSVAGSMVTYLTGITNVNAIDYKLPFERFLNPERPSAPDIDMDFADNRRDQMIQYSREKYGADKVAQIGTFGTMMAKGSIRDVARAMGFPYTLGDQISKLIPMGQQGFAMTIERAMNETPEFKELYDTNPDVRTIVDMAKQIEGCARHISVHAAGVVISPIPLTDIVPLQLDPKATDGNNTGRIITQYDMRSVDENNAGLLKFDFLGIKNLSQLSDAINLVKIIEGITIDLDEISLEDKKTFEMLARGETEGLFQLNGSGMTRFLKELKPTTIHDINAMVALYRPGPMETIPEYIRRKNDASLIKYEDPRMEKYLKESYGLIVYQDDLLFSAIELAGYSWLEADKFRKAVGKKNREEMAAQREKLTEGIIKKGQTKAFADRLWKLFEPFQAYGFNKAHAASYGNLAYKTSYMKANFPAIYMAAVLTGAHGDTEEISIYINECKRLGIPVLAPNINESFGDFTVIKGEKTGGGMDAQGNFIPEVQHDKIRFGLYSIKNFGEGIGDAIIAERKNNGPFTTLENFLDRVKDKNLNKKSLEALVKAGAMDDFGNRSVMLANLPDLLEYNKEQQKRPDNQTSLFGMFDTAPAASAGADSGSNGGNNSGNNDAGNNGSNGTNSKAVKIGGYGEHLKLRTDNIEGGLATQSQMLAWEKELLGLYITGHPLDKYREILDKRDINIEKLKKVIEADAEEFAAKVAKEADAKSALESMDRQKREFEEANGIVSDIVSGLDGSTDGGDKKDVKDEKKDTKNTKSGGGNSGEPKKRFNKEEWKKQMQANQPKERQVVVAGIIEEAKEIATKKDPTIRMMFLRLADFTGSIEVVVFPKTYEQFKSVLVPEACVAIKAKTSSRNGTPSLIIDTVKVLN
ncbi:MAG: DNA polymerase III subunit alpha [Candidatus Pacebacteria bacterium]|nr:DNA polymerase III subunit alpha [Candidatus Paceibacterota bacterium]